MTALRWHGHQCPACGAPWQHTAPRCTGTVAIRCPHCWAHQVALRERKGLTYRTDLALPLAHERYRTPA
jgi:hypothetical protein